MEVRTKDDVSVRRDALAMAVKKAESGCAPCAESYLDLARARGATEADIQSSRVQLPVGATASKGRSREASPLVIARSVQEIDELPAIDKSSERARHLRTAAKYGAGAAAGAIAAGSRLTGALAYSGIFGTDSSTQPHVAGMPTDFYIGKLGEGSTSTYRNQPVQYFNVNSAGATNEYRVTGYWFMYGPRIRTSNYSPYTWGFLQGQNAIAAWNYNPWCCMENIFADVEGPDNGWKNSSVWDNADCLNGFLDGVTASYAVTCDGAHNRFLVPGVYINVGNNGHFFPGGYAPSKSFVLWGAGAYGGRPACPGSANNCAPCRSGCDTLTPVVNNWNAGVYHGCFGAQGIQIWQFWVGGCGCGGDWDYSPWAPRTAPGAHWVPMGCR
jgi:hypothetical protein